MRLVYSIMAFFIIAQVLGLFTGLVILRDMAANPFVSGMVVTTDTESPLNALFFLAYTLLGAAVIVTLIRFFGIQKLLFRGMEFMLIATATSIVFYALLRMWLPYEEATLGGIALGLAFGALKAWKPSLKNAAALTATAGVGVIFGVSMGIMPVVLFLVLLSVYDYLAVFATRHMVEIARFVIKEDLAFTVTARAKVPEEKEERRMDLGTGDLIAPVMFEVSALSLGPAAPMFIMAGATISMGIFLALVWKKKIVLPALPPIVFGMIVAFLIGYLLGMY